MPLKILRRFEAEDEWVLGPGDMLYLPPHVAHYGVAEDECMTYSIGFRAPTTEEMAHGFLMHLQDTIALEGRYADPDLRLQAHPGEIGRAMLSQIEDMIAKIKWSKRDIAEFAGRYLSNPSRMFFRCAGHAAQPERLQQIYEQAWRHAQSQIASAVYRKALFHQRRGFHACSRRDRRTEATGRPAPSRAARACPLRERLYDWYEAGWLETDTP